MSLQSHINALKGRHESLEAQLSAEDNRPRPDGETLALLKHKKLLLKDELERLTQIP